MAGGTKRLPRAVREQQMLDAAVQVFSVNGYHETSMDAIAAKAEISKPMLYLYYGSKEDLFGACLDRELARFIEVVRADIDFSLAPHDLLRNAIGTFLSYSVEKSLARKPEEFGSLALEIARNTYFNAQCVRLDGAIRMAPR